MASIFQLLPNSRPDSINRKIFRAATIVGLLTVLSRVAAAAKELVVAHAFGRSDAVDAYLMAFVLPAFLVTLIMAALGSALLPVLAQTRQKEGEAAARKLLGSVVTASTVLLIALAIMLALCAPLYLPFLAHNFGPEKLLLTRKLLFLFLPWMVFNGLAMLLAYILNAGEKFALPALVPLLTPLVTIASIELARSKGTFSIALGMTIGAALEALLLLRLLWAHGVAVSFRWGGLDPALRGVLVQYAPLMFGSFLTGSTLVVDQSFAAMLPAGSVAALSYASKLSNAVLLIGSTALSTATLPYFSKMVAEGDWPGCRHTLKRYIVLIIILAVPLTLGLIVFSQPIVRLLFQRGAFTSADTQIVTHVQMFYCVQIPFLTLAVLFARFLSSIRRNDVVMYAAAINLTVNIVMDLVLMRIWGIAGIAASTAIVSMVSLAFLAISSARLLRHPVPVAGTVAQAHASQ